MIATASLTRAQSKHARFTVNMSANKTCFSRMLQENRNNPQRRFFTEFRFATASATTAFTFAKTTAFSNFINSGISNFPRSFDEVLLPSNFRRIPADLAPAAGSLESKSLLQFGRIVQLNESSFVSVNFSGSFTSHLPAGQRVISFSNF